MLADLAADLHRIPRTIVAWGHKFTHQLGPLLLLTNSPRINSWLSPRKQISAGKCSRSGGVARGLLREGDTSKNQNDFSQV